MSIQKNAAFLLSFPSVTAAGAANTTTVPTVYLTKDAGVQAQSAANAAHIGNGQWQIALSASEMNANVVGWIAVGSGLLPTGGTIATEADYTATRAGKLDNADVATSTRSTFAIGQNVTVATNNDKSGYSVSTVTDKTGYALSDTSRDGLVAAVWGATTRTLTSLGTLLDGIPAAVKAAMEAGGQFNPFDAACAYSGVVQPQTGDSFSRIGASGAGLTNLGDTRLANLNNIGGYSLSQIVSTLDDITSYSMGAESAGLAAKASADQAARPGAEMGLTDAARTALSDRLERAGGTLMVTKSTVDSVNTTAGQINAKTANLPASPAAVGSAMTLTPGERDAIADAHLDRAGGIETGWTPRQVSRVLAAVLAGKAGGADSDNPFFRSLNDLKTRVAAVVDEDGNRISVTYDVS